MMHSYKAAEISTCLNHSRIVYVGDSIVRQQFFAALQLVRPNVDLTGEAHVNRKYVFNEENLTLEFWWDPYLNTTQDILKGTLPMIKPSLLVVGSGAWQMHYLGKDYFEQWKTGIDALFDSVYANSQVADAVLLGPVEVPQYDKLSEDRTATMTMQKIERMNAYLRQKEIEFVGNTKTPIGIPFVWNEISSHTTNITEDGLHFKQAITSLQAQIALNYRCNDQLDKKFPMGTTCCFTYPTPRWYQNIFFLLFLIWVPTGFFISTSTSGKQLSGYNSVRKLIDMSRFFHHQFSKETLPSYKSIECIVCIWIMCLVHVFRRSYTIIWKDPEEFQSYYIHWVSNWYSCSWYG